MFSGSFLRRRYPHLMFVLTAKAYQTIATAPDKNAVLRLDVRVG
ncbi:MAG: hypothetical protein ACQXXH_08505 [Candidatus Bathyarchaeia archaeon]|nr:hypothetical protein [Candidatus Bathyarchaeota archaeon]